MRWGLNGLTLLLALATATGSSQKSSSSGSPNCRISQPIIRLPGLSEASGVAASRRTPGILWAHNDSSLPELFVLDLQGAIKGRVRVTGASVDDWEDIAVGPCPEGSCVYVGDIGDNKENRRAITLYRVPEPAPGDAATAKADVFQAAYPDGAHNAESLFVTTEADVFVITKGTGGPVALYRFPRPLVSGRTMTLERIGELIAGPRIDQRDRPTAADASSDGTWVAVRTTRLLTFHRTTELVSGRWREVFRTDLTSVGEPQGEGVAFAGNGTVVLVGEAGRSLARTGTFAKLECTLTGQ
jgi:hypothetical protein